jgi:hypothetical protein
MDATARGKNLDELEGVVWGEPNFDSYLVVTCHRLRLKPIDEFTVEDLRIMILQKISLHYLMPLAIEKLEREPLSEGNCYPGDLLNSVIDSKSEWLISHPQWLDPVVEIAKRALILLQDDEFAVGLAFLKDELNTFVTQVESQAKALP